MPYYTYYIQDFSSLYRMVFLLILDNHTKVLILARCLYRKMPGKRLCNFDDFVIPKGLSVTHWLIITLGSVTYRSNSP